MRFLTLYRSDGKLAIMLADDLEILNATRQAAPDGSVDSFATDAKPGDFIEPGDGSISIALGKNWSILE